MENLNRENLKIAIEGLKSLNISKGQFDMNFFGGIDIYDEKSARKKVKNTCNTVACAVGWCPFIEELSPIASDFNRRGFFCYNTYTKRIFGDIGCMLWQFMFEDAWYAYDNTLEGAIARMQYVYDGKYTDEWGYEDFKQGWYKKN